MPHTYEKRQDLGRGEGTGRSSCHLRTLGKGARGHEQGTEQGPHGLTGEGSKGEEGDKGDPLAWT